MRLTRTVLRTVAALVLTALAGCGSDPPGEQVTGACTPAAEKSAVLATAQDWYLYQDLVPASIDPNAYQTPQDLLDAFTQTARDQHKDRYWSYLITQQQAQQYFQAGQSAGYGIGLLIPASGPFAGKLMISQVMGGSPADVARFKRGDEIVALGPTAQSMTAVPTLIQNQTLGTAISGGTPGTVKYFSVLPRGATTAETRVVTSAQYDLDPVVWTTIQTPLRKTVGYVLLRTFVATAEDKLRTAFGDFNAKGVQDVIVDVRYNGGGLLSTAHVLGSLLHPAAGELMYRGQFNARHGGDSWSDDFAGEANRLTPGGKVAFITTGGSASASELVPNALGPYLGTNLAIIGDRTYGKPVGQAAFSLGTCQDALYLISFQLQNKAGFGGYYDGLPDASGQFGGTSCAAADDLTRDLWDAAEYSTAQALQFIDGTPCTPIAPPTATATAGTSQLRVARPAALHPQPDQPSPAQREMPGLF